MSLSAVNVLADSDGVCSFIDFIAHTLAVIAADDRRRQLVAAPGGKDPPGPLHGVSDQPGGPTLLLLLQQV